MLYSACLQNDEMFLTDLSWQALGNESVQHKRKARKKF